MIKVTHRLSPAFNIYCRTGSKSMVMRVWVDEKAVWVELNDGRRAYKRFSDYKRLAQANNEQRSNFVLSYLGIHWPDIDDDLSFEGFFY